MRALIRPGVARGELAAPPSKSMAHRLLICAALARGDSVVRGVDRSEDVLATLDCLKALGADVRLEGGSALVRGCDPARSMPATLPCRESAGTLRFMIPLCLLSGRPMRLTGGEGLMRRPLSVYAEICRERGLRFEPDGLSLRVEGKLSPGGYRVPGDVSSQFVSGLLFALPLLEGDSAIRLVPPVESRPYVDMTVHALRDFGVDVRWRDDLTLSVPGHAAFIPRDRTVEGDWSAAAVFEALNCLGGDVRVTGLRDDSLQGDRVCRAYFRELTRGPATLDVADCPDLAPILLALAAACHGGTLTGTRRLRYKESDRGEAMARELARFGVALQIRENEIIVPAGRLHAPDGPLSSHGDHRVAMALAALCARTGGEIDGAEAVRKSLPDFWERLRSLGVGVTLLG